jgi:type IX secretion system PorP/SprF family membrane protein
MLDIRTILFFLLGLMGNFVWVQAQQAPQYSMTMLDKYQFNPGYAGMDASLVVTGALKTQWDGFAGAPRFQHVNVHMPLYIANGGVGFKFIHDAIGPEATLGFEASYNYVYESAIGLFSFGVGGGIIQKSLDGSLIRTPDGIYEGFTVVHNDPILSSTKGSAISPTATVGLYFANDYLEAGIAVDQALGNTVELNNAESTSFRLRRTFNFFAEYNYPINEEVSVYPAVFAKSDGIQTQLDIGGRVDYQDIYFGGLMFRGYSSNTIDALAVFIGARVSANLSVSYGYDITLSRLASFSEGTHEFMVQYNLNKPIGIGKPERIIYNPRF